jgi:tetratricopeptide (TPR) repeat protein
MKEMFRKLRKEDKQLDYSWQLSELKSRTSPSVPLAHDIYLAYLDQLLREESNTRYANLKSEYDRMLGKYFTKSSLMNVNLKAVEFNSKLKRDKINSLEADALSVLNSKNLPQNYKTRVRILEFLAEMSTQLRRYANVEHYLNQIIEVKKELYGDNTTEYHLARLKLAIFYVDYTNKLEEAKKIFEESYVNMVSKEIKLQHKDRLPILYSLAKLYDLTDNYAQASVISKEAGDAARERFTKDQPDYAVALTQIAQLEIKLGNYEKAGKNIDDAIKVLEDKKKDDLHVVKYIHAIETQARLYGIKGMFDEADRTTWLNPRIEFERQTRRMFLLKMNYLMLLSFRRC